MSRLIINLQGSLANPNLALEAARRGDLGSLPSGPTGRIDARALADARAAGVAATCVTVGHVVGPGDPLAQTHSELRAWQQLFEQPAPGCASIRTVADLEGCAATGTPGVVLGFQNLEMLGSDVASVATFAELGVRVMQLTYNGPNRVGCGCLSPQDSGLTPFGRHVVEAMNDGGVLVDLSHAGPATLRDAMAASRKPVAVSHTGCRSLVDNPRNVWDGDLRRLADRGGVVGLFAMPFLRSSGQPMLDDYVRHIEHAIQVAGIDHVALGTDGTVTAVDDLATYLHYLGEAVASRQAAGVAAPGEDGAVALFLPDMQGPSQFEILAHALTRRGHSAAAVDKLLGHNWLRLLADVWKATA